MRLGEYNDIRPYYGHDVFIERDQAMRERISIRPPEAEEINVAHEPPAFEMELEHTPKSAERFSEEEKEIPRLVDSQPKVTHAIRKFASYLERMREELILNSAEHRRNLVEQPTRQGSQRERGRFERTILIAAVKLLLPLLTRLFPTLTEIQPMHLLNPQRDSRRRDPFAAQSRMSPK